jgi:hypothetical protein
MKLPELSKKLNPLGEAMNLHQAFDKLRGSDHSKSFDELGPWLDQNSKTTRPMKNIYKIAASFIVATLILIACSVPVEQEEEIGYMIKGISVETMETGKAKLAQLPSINKSEIRLAPVLHEMLIEDGKVLPPEQVTELVLVLPDTDYESALIKKRALEDAMSFKSIEILPIEDTFERTIFESTLHKLDIREKESVITDEHFKMRVRSFLKENTESLTEEFEVEIKLDDKGNRFVEIPMKTKTGEEANVMIEYMNDGKTINYQTLRKEPAEDSEEKELIEVPVDQ